MNRREFFAAVAVSSAGAAAMDRGLVALRALWRQKHPRKPKPKKLVAAFDIDGAGLCYLDGVLTPLGVIDRQATAWGFFESRWARLHELPLPDGCELPTEGRCRLGYVGVPVRWDFTPTQEVG